MAGIRRRRPVVGSQDLSEGESQSEQLSSASHSEDSADEFIELSEYESADEVIEEKVKCEESNQSQSEASVPSSPKSVKRERGDGKEESDVELDGVLPPGDKESPSFIPTRGSFFQHDQRSMDTRGRGQNRAYRSKPDTTRWQHDKYDEADQTPKSRSELIEEYGFDIRSFQYGEVPSRSRRGRPNRGRFNQPERSRFPRRQEEDWNEPPSKPPTAIRTQDFRAKRREDSRDVQQPAPKTNMDDVLNVINDRESKRGSKGYSNQRPTKREDYPDRAREPPRNPSRNSPRDSPRNDPQNQPREPPRRYSTQRQRNVDSPHGEFPRPTRSNPRQPSSSNPNKLISNNPTTTPSNPVITQSNVMVTPRNLTPSDPSTTLPMTQVNPNMTPSNLPPPPAQWISGELQNLRLDDYSSETSSGQFDSVSDDANIVGLQNQILSHMKPDHGAVDQMQQFEAYQQWQQVMIAQSLLNPQFPLPQQPSPLPPLATEQALLSVSESPGNPQAIDINQNSGSVGSMAFPPPNFPNNYMPANLMPDRTMVQSPMLPPQIPPLPGLLAQQVRGVTYYTPPGMQGNNLMGSPLRRPTNAIPIRHPMLQ